MLGKGEFPSATLYLEFETPFALFPFGFERGGAGKDDNENAEVAEFGVTALGGDVAFGTSPVLDMS